MNTWREVDVVCILFCFTDDLVMLSVHLAACLSANVVRFIISAIFSAYVPPQMNVQDVIIRRNLIENFALFLKLAYDFNLNVTVYVQFVIPCVNIKLRLMSFWALWLNLFYFPAFFSRSI